MNKAYLENEIYVYLAVHSYRKRELSRLEPDKELPILTVATTTEQSQPQKTQQAKIVNKTYVKPGHIIEEWEERQLKEQERRG